MSDRLGCPPALAQARIGSRGEASAARKRGAAPPGARSFFGTAARRVQAATGAVPARARERAGRGSPGWVAPGSSPARVADRAGSVRSLPGAARSFRCARSDAVAPRRTSKGNKAHGRTGGFAAGNGRGAPELDGGATPRSRRGGLERDRRQRQGGNGHGDVARLPARIPSGGVRCAAGKVSVLPRDPVRWVASWNPAPRNAVNPMTGSGMQQARDLRAEETVEVVRNHEGGTGFRGWPLGTDARDQRRAREWTLGGSHPCRACAARGRWRGDSAPGARRGRDRVGTPHESHERRSRFDQGQQRELWRGAKAWRAARCRFFRKEGAAVGAVPPEDLGGPRGNAQGQGGSGKPTSRYGHAAVICQSSVSDGGMPGPRKVASTPGEPLSERPVSAGSTPTVSRCPSIL